MDSRLANGLKKAEQERIKQQRDIKKHTIDLANRQRIEEVQQEILGKKFLLRTKVIPSNITFIHF